MPKTKFHGIIFNRIKKLFEGIQYLSTLWQIVREMKDPAVKFYSPPMEESRQNSVASCISNDMTSGTLRRSHMKQSRNKALKLTASVLGLYIASWLPYRNLPNSQAFQCS